MIKKYTNICCYRFMQSKLIGLCSFIYLLTFTKLSYAAESVGDLAQNILEPTSMMAKVIYALCYSVGAMLIVGSFIQYKNHKDNPTQIRLSTPIFLFIFGVLLIVLPILTQYAKGAGIIDMYY